MKTIANIIVAIAIIAILAGGACAQFHNGTPWAPGTTHLTTVVSIDGFCPCFGGHTPVAPGDFVHVAIIGTPFAEWAVLGTVIAPNQLTPMLPQLYPFIYGDASTVILAGYPHMGMVPGYSWLQANGTATFNFTIPPNAPIAGVTVLIQAISPVPSQYFPYTSSHALELQG